MAIDRVCIYCGKTFYAKLSRIKLGRAKYCSYECVNNDKKRRLVIECEYCGVEFKVWPSRSKGNRKYCSRNCMYKAQTGKGNPNWKGGEHTLKCFQCGREYKEDRNMANRRKFCSRVCFNKWQEINLRGKNNSNWKNGITTENQAIRASKEYEDWKDTVFKRDDYTCALCGKRGGDLNSHHVLPFVDFPEYRLKIDNGITHCKECHKILTTILSWGHFFQPLPQLSA